MTRVTLPLLALVFVLMHAVAFAADDAPAITADNADQLVPVAAWGRGMLRAVDWAADVPLMGALTSAGLWLYDADDPAQEPELIATDSRKTYSLSMSPDGRFIATGDWDAGAQLYDRRMNAYLELPALPNTVMYDQWVTTVAFSPDGRWLAAGKHGGEISLWRVKADETARVEPPYMQDASYGEIGDLAFSASGMRLAFSARNTEADLGVWNLMANTVTIIPTADDLDITAVAISPDGRTVASALRTAVRLWDADSGAHIRSHETDGDFIDQLHFSDDGASLVAAGLNGDLYRWDVAGGDGGSWHLFEPGYGKFVGLSLSDAAGLRAAVSTDDRLLVWMQDTLADQQLAEPVALAGYNWTLWKVAAASDNRTFATTSRDGTGIFGAPFVDVLRVWHMGEALPRASMTGHEWLVMDVLFNAEGSRLYSASQDETARVWNAASGELQTLFAGHESYLQDLALSPDETQMATAAGDDSVRLWDVATGALLQTFAATGAEAVAFGTDGNNLLAFSRDGVLHRWTLSDGRVSELTLGGHDWSDGFPESALFTPDAAALIVGFSDGAVSVWNSDTAELRATLIPEVDAVYSGIYSLALSPDGQLLATGDGEGIVRLWNLADSTRAATLRAHTDWVPGLAFTPDGTRLISVSWDGTIRLWSAVG